MFGKFTGKDKRDMARIICNIMKDAFLTARDRGLAFEDIVDLANGIEADMTEAFEEWLEDDTYDFEVSDCDEFMERNARACMEVASMAKSLELGYKFDALDPHVFVSELYGWIAYELTVFLYDSSDIVSKIVRDGFKMGFMEEYILSNEADKYITAEAVEEVLDRMEQRTFDNAEC